MSHQDVQIPPGLYPHMATLYEYNQLHHELRRCSVGVALGSHDLGVATFAAELFHRKLFPLLVFTGANSPTTAGVFPEGEAYRYRQHALELGVPEEAILTETRALNTWQNIEFTRQLLLHHDLHPNQF